MDVVWWVWNVEYYQTDTIIKEISMCSASKSSVYPFASVWFPHKHIYMSGDPLNSKLHSATLLTLTTTQASSRVSLCNNSTFYSRDKVLSIHPNSW